MTLKDSYQIIGLNEGASLDEVKSAYRKRAFDLHPDLNPNTPNASKEFHKLNEAYVFLSKHLSPATKKQNVHGTHTHADTSKTREEAQKAYGKAKHTTSTKKEPQQEEVQEETSKEDLLNDILRDDFARRVFEDIYRHITEENKTQQKTHTEQKKKTEKGKTTTQRKSATKTPKKGVKTSNGPVTKISGWFRKQFDDKQTISLPRASLVAGAKIRLEIQHGLLTEPQTVELVLPDNFNIEKPIRLKGMGKHIGNWHGDLYLEINPY